MLGYRFGRSFYNVTNNLMRIGGQWPATPVRNYTWGRILFNGAHMHTREAMRRLGPPPLFGKPGYYYNDPGLTVSSPTISDTTGYKRVVISPYSHEQVFTRDYFVDVPFGLFPGEVFRVLINGDEYLIECPEITRSGERIVVSFLH